MLGVLAIVLFFEFRRYLDKGHPTLTARAHNAAPEVLVIGLVLAALIIGATLSKRRAMLGFSLLLGGLALLQLAGIFGLVYLGIGLWMVFRAMRKPRPATATAGGTGVGRRRAAAGQGTATAPEAPVPAARAARAACRQALTSPPVRQSGTRRRSPTSGLRRQRRREPPMNRAATGSPPGYAADWHQLGTPDLSARCPDL